MTRGAFEKCGHAPGNQRGAALVISVFLTMALSILATSLMFLAQTETYASMNYRLMSQARYGAESGVHKAANYLINTYTAPGAGGIDPLGAYNLTKSPAILAGNGQPVVLSATSAVPSNYPVAATQTAFSSAAAGSLSVGNTTIQYGTYATLLSMQQVEVYGTSALATIQTWQITANATIGTGRTASVEVSAVLERQLTPAGNYAAFATYAGCDALGWSGGGSTDSYNSVTVAPGSTPALQASGGNVGTNGNLTETGNKTTINGTLYTPRTGVGNCSSNNITAWTDNGNATVTGGVAQLPQAVTLTPPDAPNPLPPTTNQNFDKNSGCGSQANCTTIDGDGIRLTASASLGDRSTSNVGW